MTQTLIEKLEALPTYAHHSDDFDGFMFPVVNGEYIKASDLRAIIEDAKAEKQDFCENTLARLQAGVANSNEQMTAATYILETATAIDAYWFCAQLLDEKTREGYVLPQSVCEAFGHLLSTPQPDIVADLVKALEPIGQRFISGNDVPVSRASVPVEEWYAVQTEFEKRCNLRIAEAISTQRELIEQLEKSAALTQQNVMNDKAIISTQQAEIDRLTE